MAVTCIDNSAIPFDTQPNCESCFNTDYCTLVETTQTTELQFELTPVTGVNVLPEGAFTSQAAGTADGTSANKLVDSTATFALDGVLVGAIVRNTTDNTYASVTAIDSETQLTLDTDIFVSGEDYIIINWDITSGTLGTGVTFDGTSVSFQTSSAAIELADKLVSGRYYRIKVTSTTNGIGTGRFLITNGTGLSQYFELGLFNHTESIVYIRASGTGIRLSFSGVAPTTTYNVTDIEIVEMSSLYYELTDCDDNTVVYDSSATIGISYNQSVQYQDNPNAPFYGVLRLAWADYVDLPATGCFCLCVKDYAASLYNYVTNGAFTITSFNQAPYWDLTNSGSAGFAVSSNELVHSSEAAAGTDEASQTLQEALDATLCYNLTFDYNSDAGYTFLVKYDTDIDTDVTLATVTHGSGAGSETIAITNIAITRLYFVADDDEQFKLDNIAITLDPDCWACSCQSTCISIAPDQSNRIVNGCLFEITATNDNNAFGFNYEDFTFTQRMLLFGKLRNATYQDDTEYYTKSSGEKVLVYAEIEKVQELQIMEVPEGIHDWLHMAMLHDTFMIDGVEYVRVGEYAPNWRKSSQKAPVIVQVAKKTQKRFNTFS